MKAPLFFILILFSANAFAQHLTEFVHKSFDKQFPDQTISSWVDNSYYNYDEDWNNDIYYGDYNYDGYINPIDLSFQTSGFDPDQLHSYSYAVPEGYVVKTEVAPTYYQLHFMQDEVKMTALFKPDGTFVIAKGRVYNLPEIVTSTIMGQFKGKTIKIEHAIEKIYVPNTSVPVYRVKVELPHEKNHLLKVNGKGKVISNTLA